MTIVLIYICVIRVLVTIYQGAGRRSSMCTSRVEVRLATLGNTIKSQLEASIAHTHLSSCRDFGIYQSEQVLQ